MERKPLVLHCILHRMDLRNSMEFYSIFEIFISLKRLLVETVSKMLVFKNVEHNIIHVSITRHRILGILYWDRKKKTIQLWLRNQDTRLANCNDLSTVLFWYLINWVVERVASKHLLRLSITESSAMLMYLHTRSFDVCIKKKHWSTFLLSRKQDRAWINWLCDAAYYK